MTEGPLYFFVPLGNRAVTIRSDILLKRSHRHPIQNTIDNLAFRIWFSLFSFEKYTYFLIMVEIRANYATTSLPAK